MRKNLPTLILIEFSLVVIVALSFLIISPGFSLKHSQAATQTLTLYYRSDTRTVNGLTAYQLSTSNSNTLAEFGGSKTYSSAGTAEFSSDVSIVHLDGSETLIGSV